ncbi:insertion element protein [Sutcliffiella horikoshii]|uniref:Insertion element protein n=1 Tax=Sutcliffiella horikoshii TaxID=79883 RepID=A0A5D4SP99_9BACI|nr:insertion element protein [Sutcliffiella horikoshii]TYS64551.1 insertion element protein [Sutcliffiella horikoshii]
MALQKRLSSKDDVIVEIIPPVSEEELKERHNNYHLIPPKKFAFEYRGHLHRPVTIRWKERTFEIQLNHCINPFCKSYFLPQKRYETKGKPSRYKLGTPSNGDWSVKQIYCNTVPDSTEVGMSLNCKSLALSNWSIADEISRLVRINTPLDNKPQYIFHKEECPFQKNDPFVHPNTFYKQGLSSTGSQRYQCKSCKKKTSLTPKREESITYNQKRHDVLHLFAKLLLNKTPISRACDILDIGKGTYYEKLKFLYRRCLEFLERHETNKLSKTKFSEIWLSTDQMLYYLSNERKKGMGSKNFDDLDELNFQTRIIITSDANSRYVFRSDIAYDWDINFSDIEEDTKFFKSDHLNDLMKRYARIIKFKHFPQPPTQNDTQSKSEYNSLLRKVKQREKYKHGLHVSPTYTAIAHFWLIKHLLNVSEWRFVTDQDKSLMSAIYRVFGKEIRLSDAHHFLCQTDKAKSRTQSTREYQQALADLQNWGIEKGYEQESAKQLAILQLEELFRTHKFHEVKHTSKGSFNTYADNPIEHPLASPDRGYRWIDCTTDLSSLEPLNIAKLAVNVSDQSTDAFIQLIRRRLSPLERPIHSAKADKKNYMYSNSNPEYAQMAVTILRTYYNFCFPIKTKSGKKTPAQRLGITDKQFDLKDIIYLR